MNGNWVRIIHVAKSKTGIDEASYRGILAGAGCESSKDITTVQQFNLIMDSFKALGFSYKPLPGRTKKTTVQGNPGYITERQEYYIRGLWSLASRSKDEASLRAMIKRIGSVDDISFLHRSNATSVILALRDICEKAGYNPDTAQRE